MAKKEKIASIIAGTILFMLSAIITISLFMGILDFGSVTPGKGSALYNLGSMLYTVYGLSSIFIPVFLFVAGAFSLDSSWSLPKMFSLLISFIPFFTLAGAEHYCRTIAQEDTSPLSMIKIIGLLFIAILLVAVEYLLTIVFASKLEQKLSGANKITDKQPNSEKLEQTARKLKASVEDVEDLPPEVIEEAEPEELTQEVKTEELSYGTETVINEESLDDGIDPDINAAVNKSIEEATDDTNWTLDEILNRHKKILKESAEEPVIDDIWSIDNEGKPKSKKDESKTNENEVDMNSDPWNVTTPIEKVEETKPDSSSVVEEKQDVQQEEIEPVEEIDEVKIDEQNSETVSNTENVSQPMDDLPSEEESINEEEALIVEETSLNHDVFFEEPVIVESTEIAADDDIISQFEQQNMESADDFMSQLSNDSIEEQPVQQSEIDEETIDEIDALEQANKEDSNFDKGLEIEEEPENLSSKAHNHSMISALDGVFAKMEEDAIADYNSGDLENHYDEDEDEDILEPEFDMDMEDFSEEQLEEDSLPEAYDDEESQEQNIALDNEEETEVKADIDMTKTAVVTSVNSNGEVTTAPIPRSVPKRGRRGSYKIPTEILTAYEENQYWIIDDETNRAAALLKETLSEFKIEVTITGIRKGPVVTMFEMLPAPGVNVTKIVSLSDNIALRLAASSVRIVPHIPGKTAMGIEIPNKERAIVSFRECIEQNRPEWKKMAVPVILGKDIQGEVQLMDLVKTPHLLIAGATGAGKSVCVNSMILSILYKRSPNDVKMILIDPKIVELKLYNDIPHLLTPVITEPKKALQALQYCLCEMERRYAVLDGMGCRDISNYNKKIEEQHIAQEKLPYLIVVIDEFADLMATTGKQMEGIIARLAAMSRAVGIHLVLATQRPSIDVITGLIKANIPSRIAFMVASKTDSRIILDQVGAEKLLGKGDMLYASATDPFPTRIQGAFISDQEVEDVVDAVKEWGEPDYIDDEIFVDDDDDEGSDQMSLFNPEGDDPLYDRALEIVVQAGKASASYIQRRLKIGYNRAARLVEEMEARGIVGPANGSKPRELIHVP